MQKEMEVNTEYLINILIEEINSFKHIISMSSRCDFSISYLVFLGGRSAIYAFKTEGFILSHYTIWYNGVNLEIKKMNARKVYKAMEKIFKLQERAKRRKNIKEFESIITQYTHK